MKTLLKDLLAGKDIHIGRYQVYCWSDNSGLVARQERTGLLDSPEGLKPTLKDLRRLLDWIDANP